MVGSTGPSPEEERDCPGVVVLYNDSTRLAKGEARDMLAERGEVACAQAIAEALAGAGRRVERLPLRPAKVIPASAPGWIETPGAKWRLKLRQSGLSWS